MKLKQRKSRSTPAAAAPAKSPKASKPTKSSGVIAFIAEKADKTRGVVDWHARKSGTRSL